MAADFQKAEYDAIHILKKYNITESFVNLHKIIKGEELHITISKLKPEWKKKLLGFYNDNTKTIYVNSNLSPVKTRLTIACALGHYLMHQDYINSEKHQGLMCISDRLISDKSNIEKEAYAFATNLLIPLGTLEKYRDKATVPQLKDLFGISEEMLGYRLILKDS